MRVRDDLAVVFGRCIEVVIVIVETGRLEALRLGCGQHAERGAGLEAELLDTCDHAHHPLEIAVLRLAPGRAHAESAGAGRLRLRALRASTARGHEFLGVDARVEMRALRTVGAVLGAAAGLDRKQRRDLNFVRVEVSPMDALRAEYQLRKRQIEQRAHFLATPIVPGLGVWRRG